jgi:hypothetical protein
MRPRPAPKAMVGEPDPEGAAISARDPAPPLPIHTRSVYHVFSSSPKEV